LNVAPFWHSFDIISAGIPLPSSFTLTITYSFSDERITLIFPLLSSIASTELFTKFEIIRLNSTGSIFENKP